MMICIAAVLQAFFADIYAEARKAKPGLGHRALAQVAGAHKLLTSALQRSSQLRIRSSAMLLLCRHSLPISMQKHAKQGLAWDADKLLTSSLQRLSQLRIQSSALLLLCRRSLLTSMQKHAKQSRAWDTEP